MEETIKATIVAMDLDPNLVWVIEDPHSARFHLCYEEYIEKEVLQAFCDYVDYEFTIKGDMIISLRRC